MFSPFKKSSRAPEYLIVGLGNPGSDYSKTRHNAGFMCIDSLSKKHDISVMKLKFNALYGDGTIADKRCLLVKPQTYMNNSGEAVRDIMKFYKIPAEKVIVIFDDISLDVGKIRVRRNGSDGGHNGIKSIIYLTDTEDFPRVKIGVSGKPNPNYDLASWVLSEFRKDEMDSLQNAVEKEAGAVEFILKGDIDKAMNLYN